MMKKLKYFMYLKKLKKNIFTKFNDFNNININIKMEFKVYNGNTELVIKLDEDDTTDYIKNIIAREKKISIDNIKLYIVEKKNGITSKKLINGDPPIINNAIYEFRLENINTVSNIPVKMETGFINLIDIKNGKPYIKRNDGIEYNGDIADGSPHGKGVLTLEKYIC
jgi:hypothetical protein